MRANEKIKEITLDTLICGIYVGKTKHCARFCDYRGLEVYHKVWFDKTENLDGAVKNSFRKLATFANPEFYKKQKLRISVYNISMVIDCSKEDEKYLKLPRGTYDYLESLYNINNIEIKKRMKDL